MVAELQLLRPFPSNAFAAFHTCSPTNIRATPKKSLVGRRKECFTILPSQRTRGALASSCLQPNQPNREDLSPGHRHDLKRNVKLLTASEFGSILTSIVTASAGGPALAIWGIFFLILGKYTGTPIWLQAISTCLFAGITDALGYNWTSFSFDLGFTPFFVFFFGCGATLLYESASSSTRAEEYEQLSNSNRSNQESRQIDGASHNHDVRPNASSRENQLAKWDQAFNEARRDTDGNAK